LPVGGGVLTGGEAFDSHPETGPERGLCRVEAREKLPLQGGGEKTPGKVFRVFIVFAKPEANVLVNRFPIKRDHTVQGFARPTRTRCLQHAGQIEVVAPTDANVPIRRRGWVSRGRL
jgi:hypothetical protein